MLESLAGANNMNVDPIEQIEELTKKFELKNDTDIFVFNGHVNPETSKMFRKKVNEKRARKSNVLLVLTTFGGVPDDGYRMARTLQSKYNKFTIYVPSFCKSTGTLIALGASEIIIGECGELGPLDMQLRKADELWETSSGLNLTSALSQLDARVSESFSKHFFEMKQRFLFSTKTASEIATRLSESIYKGIADQIDPIQLGETNRSLLIARQYGESLNNKSTNLKEDALARLIAGYQSHGYVIDLQEAETLFKNVRSPNEEEACIFAEVDSFISITNVAERGKDLAFYVTDLIALVKENSKQSEEVASKNQGDNYGKQQESTRDQQDSASKRSKDGGLSEQIESDVLPNSQSNGESVPLPAKKDNRTKSKSGESSQSN